MGKGGSSGSSNTTNNVPAELSGLTQKSADTIGGLQDAIPLSGFTGQNPVQIAPLSGTQNKSLGLLNQNLNDAMSPLDQAPIVQAGHNYFTHSIAPGITNQATLSGLGRSTANTNALAAAEAQTALPLLQQEQQRRDQMINQGFTGGDIERSVQQQGYNADQADAIRRQALAEQSLFGVFGNLPSTLGQSTSSKNSGAGGMFK